MQIHSLATRALRWPIAGWGAARGRAERAAIVVEVRAASGAIGLGEAAPLPGMSTDRLDDAARGLAALAALAPVDTASPGFAAALAAAPPAARFAIETALADADARARGVALGAGWAAGPARPVPLAAVVDDAEAAARAFALGIRCLKLKLGADDDLQRARAISEAAPGARLRIDANRSWRPADVRARLAALAELPIDYVEEPCRDAHRLLGERLAVRLALDESLAELGEAELAAALASPGLAAVVLKPSLLGGLAAAFALAGRARAAGVAAIVSHALEGPIGTAACAELALALGGDRPVGLAAHAALTGWQLRVAQLGPAELRPASAPGLGFAALDLDGVVRACPASALDPADPAEGGAR